MYFLKWVFDNGELKRVLGTSSAYEDFLKDPIREERYFLTILLVQYDTIILCCASESSCQKWVLLIFLHLLSQIQEASNFYQACLPNFVACFKWHSYKRFIIFRYFLPRVPTRLGIKVDLMLPYKSVERFKMKYFCLSLIIFKVKIIKICLRIIRAKSWHIFLNLNPS